MTQQEIINDPVPYNDETWQNIHILKFERENFPLKFERIPKLWLSEGIQEMLSKFPEDCQNCNEIFACAAFAMELSINKSGVKNRMKEHRKEQREQKRLAKQNENNAQLVPA